MENNSRKSLKPLMLLAAFILSAASALADRIINFEGQRYYRSGKDQQSGQDLYEPVQDYTPFDISLYSDEIIAVVSLVAIVAFLRHILPHRHRRGCTVWVLFFAVVGYVIFKAI